MASGPDPSEVVEIKFSEVPISERAILAENFGAKGGKGGSDGSDEVFDRVGEVEFVGRFKPPEANMIQESPPRSKKKSLLNVKGL